MAKRSKVGIVLMIITCLSKVAALLLTLFFSRAFGANMLTDAYYAASTIPNLVNNSLTVCSLTLFIPLYIDCRNANGEMGTSHFSSSVLNTYTLFNFALSILVCITSPILAKVVAPGFEGEAVYHTRNLICLLSLSFSITIATQVIANICNANRDHIVQASLTLMNHLVTIILLITVAPHFGIYSYPFICIFAWTIHLVIQYIYGKRYFKHDLKAFINDKYLKTMLRLSIPVIIATASEQINLAVDNVICSTLSSGSISYLGYSHKIHTAVLGTFTAVLMTIYYPIISQDYSSNSKKQLNADIRKYIDIMIMLILPVSLYLIFSSKIVIHILYGGGSISESGLRIVSLLFVAYSSGLIFAATKELCTKLFYVIQKTNTPMVISIVCVCINIILSIILKQFIGIYGIAIATTIATLICAIIQCICLIRAIGGLKNFLSKQIINVKNLFQVIVATAISSFGIILISKTEFLFSKGYIIPLIVSAGVFFGLYAFILVLLRNEYCVESISTIISKHKRHS